MKHIKLLDVVTAHPPTCFKLSHVNCMEEDTFIGFDLYFIIIIFFNYALQPLRLIVRSGLDVPTFATRRPHACYHATAPSSERWTCRREMSGNFA